MNLFKKIFGYKKNIQKTKNVVQNTETAGIGVSINLNRLECTEEEKSEINQFIIDKLNKGEDLTNIACLLCFKFSVPLKLDYSVLGSQLDIQIMKL